MLRIALANIFALLYFISPNRAFSITLAKEPRPNCALFPLHCAAYDNHAETVSTLIEYGISYDSQDIAGNTPLHFAVQQKANAALDVLLSFHANTNLANKIGYSAISMAAIYASSLEVFKKLLASGGKIDIIDIKKRNLLHLTESAEILSYLLPELKQKIEDEDADRYTPLLAAIKSANVQKVELLLEAGADVNHSGYLFPLLLALQNKHVEICLRLLRVANIHLEHVHGGVPVLFHSTFDKRVFEAMLASGAKPDVKDFEGNTLLHKAAQSGDVDTLDILLPLFSNVNVINKNSESPTRYALKGLGRNSAVDEKIGDAIARMFIKGGHPDLYDKRPSLHWYCQNSYELIAEKIIKAGANPNEAYGTDPYTMNSLPITIAVYRNDFELVTVLTSLGADLTPYTEVSKMSLNPLVFAVKNKKIDMGKHLLQLKANPNLVFDKETLLTKAIINSDEATAVQWITAVAKGGADINAVSESCFTPLFAAISNDYLEAVRVILELGANVDAVPCNKERAILGAMNQGKAELFGILGKHVNFDTDLFLKALNQSKDEFFEVVTQRINRHLIQTDGKNLVHTAAVALAETMKKGGFAKINPRIEKMLQSFASEHDLFQKVDNSGLRPIDYFAFNVGLIENTDGVGQIYDAQGGNLVHVLAKRPYDFLTHSGNPYYGRDYRVPLKQIEACLHALKKMGVDLNQIDQSGKTPLMSAVDTANGQIAELLLKIGEGHNFPLHQTLLHVAVKKLDSRIAKMLIENGFDPDAMAGETQTPRQIAMALGNEGNWTKKVLTDAQRFVRPWFQIPSDRLFPPARVSYQSPPERVMVDSKGNVYSVYYSRVEKFDGQGKLLWSQTFEGYSDYTGTNGVFGERIACELEKDLLQCASSDSKNIYFFAIDEDGFIVDQMTRKDSFAEELSAVFWFRAGNGQASAFLSGDFSNNYFSATQTTEEKSIIRVNIPSMKIRRAKLVRAANSYTEIFFSEADSYGREKLSYRKFDQHFKLVEKKFLPNTIERQYWSMTLNSVTQHLFATGYDRKTCQLMVTEYDANAEFVADFSIYDASSVTDCQKLPVAGGEFLKNETGSNENYFLISLGRELKVAKFSSAEDLQLADIQIPSAQIGGGQTIGAVEKNGNFFLNHYVSTDEKPRRSYFIFARYTAEGQLLWSDL